MLLCWTCDKADLRLVCQSNLLLHSPDGGVQVDALFAASTGLHRFPWAAIKVYGNACLPVFYLYVYVCCSSKRGQEFPFLSPDISHSLFL